ncbi:hypothetical protein RF11_09600 [Thelohanellus kitauei]|uniref:Uncharacterized protein n=1 Tax=Thelohanellus kitauei TaxID=669202 RepID=A0A0C2IZP6_THEKT|nr:hypothetical protein RF11_09600 [Thelohanellus kitauei]
MDFSEELSSYSVVVEMQILQPKTNEILFEVNMTGWRTTCTLYHDTPQLVAIIVYDPKWSDFYLKMRIIDIFFETEEKSIIFVTNRTFVNVANSDIYLSNSDNPRTWILLAPKETKIYSCRMFGMDMTLTEYIFKRIVIKSTFEGLWEAKSENEVLIRIRIREDHIRTCKNDTQAVMIYDH